MSLDVSVLPYRTCRDVGGQMALQGCAASEMRRVLVPGGRTVLAIWRGIEHLTLFGDLTNAEARHLEKLGVPYEDIAAPFLMDSAEEIREVLETGGFRDVSLSDATVMVTFPSAATFVRDVELAYASVMPHFVENPDAFTSFVEAVERDIRPKIEHSRDGDGVRFPLRTRMVTARV
jgi:hypothetical protein